MMARRFGGGAVVPVPNPIWRVTYSYPDYVKSDGSTYINTGESYTWLDGMALEVKFTGLQVKSYARVFGDNVFNLMEYSTNGTICTEYSNNTSSGVSQSTKVAFSADTEYTLRLENDICYLNGTQIVNYSSASDYTSSTNLYIFSTSNTWDNNPTGMAASCTIFYLKIWKDDVLIHNYIPCVKTYKNSSTVGMMDTVTNTFLAPTGTLTYE